VEGKDIPFHPFVLELYLASISFNGSTITWPDSRASGYAATILTAIQAICAGALAKSGGSQALTAALNLGATYGVTAASFTALGTSTLTTLNSTTVNAAVVNATNVGPALAHFAGVSISTAGRYIRPAGGSGTVNSTEIGWYVPSALKIRAVSGSFSIQLSVGMTLSVRVNGVEAISISIEDTNSTFLSDQFEAVTVAQGDIISIEVASYGGSSTEAYITVLLGTA
jgi:hypothetical protein